jgi:hypothetical protein
MVVIHYFKRLFSLWTTLVFLVVDIALYIIGSLSLNLPIPPWAYWVLAGIGFTIANFQLFAEQDEKIREYESGEANIILFNVEDASAYLSSAGVVERDRVKNDQYQDGLDDNGVPYTVFTYATVEFANIGKESGELHWEIDRKKSYLPNLFTFHPLDPNGHFGGDLFSHIRIKIDGQENDKMAYRSRLQVTTTNIPDFSRLLREAKHYRIFLRYKTKRVGKFSKTKTISIEGNFDEFRNAVIQKWHDRGPR